MRPGAPLAHPVEITIGIALPWALAQDAPPRETARHTQSLPATAPAISYEPPNGGNSGRDQFIRRMLMAEACLANRKFDVAVMILEELTEQIDRYRLEEWESPRLVTHVWDLLRRCYLLASPSPDGAERSVALLRRICRLDPSRVIESNEPRPNDIDARRPRQSACEPVMSTEHPEEGSICFRVQAIFSK